MWTSKLRKNYDNNYAQFQAYDETYGVAKRLGYRSAKAAWDANPTIQGSTDPRDFKVVKRGRKYRRNVGLGNKGYVRKKCRLCKGSRLISMGVSKGYRRYRCPSCGSYGNKTRVRRTKRSRSRR